MQASCKQGRRSRTTKEDRKTKWGFVDESVDVTERLLTHWNHQEPRIPWLHVYSERRGGRGGEGRGGRREEGGERRGERIGEGRGEERRGEERREIFHIYMKNIKTIHQV